MLELIKVWKLLIAKSDRFAWKLEIAGSGNKDYEKIIRHEARTIPDKYITFWDMLAEKLSLIVLEMQMHSFYHQKAKGCQS